MAKSVNQVTLLGNLTRDPELRQTPTGHSVTSFSLALNRAYKDQSGEWQESANYIDCVAWSSLAERINDKCFKGARILVQGRLQSRSWEKDGQKRSKVEVLVSDVVFLMPKTDGDQTQSSYDTSQNSASNYGSVDDDPIDLSDIPF